MSDNTQTGELPVSDHARRQADRRRAARSREKRQQAGQTRISAWVPRERATYAHQVLRAVVAGANVLPPDPEQEKTLEALRAELDQVRTVAVRHEGELAAERDAASLRVSAVERERDETRRELAKAEAAATKAEAAATQARTEAERFQKAPGLRGRAIRWLAR